LGGDPRTVTDERWQLAYRVYEAAACMMGAEREQYVRVAAPDDEIAAKVLAMLAETEAIVDADTVANASNPAADWPSNNLESGASVGRFVITGFVGQGGMGRVYSAH